MTKAFVDEIIRNLKKAGFVSKTAFWMIEGIADKEVNVRFVGLKLKGDWLDIFSEKDNILLKFVVARNISLLEFYVANSTPFIKIYSTSFSETSKWELLLGELKRRLKKDKSEAVSHNETVGNIYIRIKPFLK